VVANVYIDSYNRPDSLLSRVSKLLVKIVFKNMFNHLHVNSLLYKFPSGFIALGTVSSIDFNTDNALACGSDINNISVNTTVPWAVHKSR
jgi:hypothetical protein